MIKTTSLPTKRINVSALTGKQKRMLTDRVRIALDSSTKAVEKAITILYARQTVDEKQTEMTRHDNQVGVRHNHGRRIVYYGRWLAGGRHLTGYHLDRARAMCHTYAATQLMELAAVKLGWIKLRRRP